MTFGVFSAWSKIIINLLADVGSGSSLVRPSCVAIVEHDNESECATSASSFDWLSSFWSWWSERRIKLLHFSFARVHLWFSPSPKYLLLRIGSVFFSIFFFLFLHLLCIAPTEARPFEHMCHSQMVLPHCVFSLCTFSTVTVHTFHSISYVCLWVDALKQPCSDERISKQTATSHIWDMCCVCDDGPRERLGDRQYNEKINSIFRPANLRHKLKLHFRFAEHFLFLLFSDSLSSLFSMLHFVRSPHCYRQTSRYSIVSFCVLVVMRVHTTF